MSQPFSEKDMATIDDLTHYLVLFSNTLEKIAYAFPRAEAEQVMRAFPSDSLSPLESDSTNDFLERCRIRTSQPAYAAALTTYVEILNFSSAALSRIRNDVLFQHNRKDDILEVADENAGRQLKLNTRTELLKKAGLQMHPTVLASLLDDESDSDDGHDGPVSKAVLHLEEKVVCNFGQGKQTYTVVDCGETVFKGHFVILSDSKKKLQEVPRDLFDKCFINVA